MSILTFLNGYKTYISVAGLIGLAIYQISTGQYLVAIQSIMAALGLVGLHADMAKATS